jgi:hypothetical protein
MENVLKIASGNENKLIIYRNGDVDINGSRSNFPWIATNLYKIADIFCPSNYTANFKQMFLMKDGNLYDVDCDDKTTTLLTSNIDRFLSKNSSHRSDALLAANNGDIYQGSFLNSKKHGYGEYIYLNGDIYEGDWQNDLKEGYGIYKWNNGDIYDGYWHQGKRNGHGKYAWQNGNVYQGEWVGGARIPVSNDKNNNDEIRHQINDGLSISSVH